jgi:hypothetical protein
MAGAEAVRFDARLLAGDPLAVAGRSRDAAVERRRKLQGDHWPPLRYPQKKAEIDLGRLIPTDRYRNIDAGLAQACNAASGDARVRILHRHNDASDPGFEQSVAARTRHSHVVAGLERHIGHSSARELSCPLQRFRLGMRTASWLRPTTANDAAVAYQHAANRWVRPHTAKATSGKRQGGAHFGDIGEG